MLSLVEKPDVPCGGKAVGVVFEGEKKRPVCGQHLQAAEKSGASVATIGDPDAFPRICYQPGRAPAAPKPPSAPPPAPEPTAPAPSVTGRSPFRRGNR